MVVTVAFAVFVFRTGSVAKTCSHKTNEKHFTIGFKDNTPIVQSVVKNILETHSSAFYNPLKHSMNIVERTKIVFILLCITIFFFLNIHNICFRNVAVYKLYNRCFISKTSFKGLLAFVLCECIFDILLVRNTETVNLTLRQ